MATRHINNISGVGISVGEVNFEPVRNLKLTDVLVKGTDGDTILTADEILLKMSGFDFRNRSIIFDSIELDSICFQLKKYWGETGPASSNIGRFISSLKLVSGKHNLKSKEKQKTPWTFNLKKVKLKNSTFCYYNTAYVYKEFGINWKNICCTGLNAEFLNFDLRGNPSFDVSRFSCREISGLNLNNLSGEVAFLPGKVLITSLNIKLPKSDLDIKKLSFAWDRNSGGWKNYIQCIGQTLEVSSGSYLSFEDLSYFAPALRGITSVVEFEGKVSGPVADMAGTGFHFIIDDKTKFQADFSLSGLPDARNMIMDIRLHEGHFSPEGLSNIYLPWIKGNIPVPSQLFVFDDIYASDLTLYGKPTDFAINMTSLTKGLEGHLNFELLSAVPVKGKRSTEYAGGFEMSGVDLGKIGKTPLLGNAVLTGSMTGKNSSGSSDIKLNVYADSLNVGTGMLDSIEAYVFVGNRGVNVYAGIDDRRIKANGIFSMEKSDSISNFNFASAKLSLMADSLNQFGFSFADSVESLSFGMNMVSVNSGNSGYSKLSLDTLRYQNTRGLFKMDSLVVNLSNFKDSADLNVRSDLFDMDVAGNLYDLLDKSLPVFIQNRYCPSLLSDAEKRAFRPGRRHRFETMALNACIKTKNMNSFLSVAAPDIFVGDSTWLYFSHTPDDSLKLALWSDSVRFNKFYLSNPRIDVSGYDSAMILDARAEKFTFNSILSAGNIRNSCRINTDSLYNKLLWDNAEDLDYSGNVSFGLGLDRISDILFMDLEIDESKLVIADSIWNVAPSSLKWFGDEILVNRFSVQKGNSFYSLDGKISKDTLSTLKLALNDISLSSIDRFFFPNGNAKFFGNLSAYCEVGDFYRNRRMELGFNLKKWGMRKDTLGDFSLSSMWDFNNNKLIVQGLNKYKNIVPFYLYGNYTPATDDIDIEVKLKTLSLPGFNDYVKKFLRFNSGSVSGELNCIGTVKHPQVFGSLSVDSADVYVNMFNTSFRLNDKMNINGNKVLVDQVKVLDVYGNQAEVNGSYDLLGGIFDFTAQMDNFLVMNTKTSFGANFYGNLSAGGVAHLDNKNRELNIAMDVVTGQNSTLYLPLVFEMGDADKILSFKKSGKLKDVHEKGMKSTIPINLDANLEVNDNLEMQVIFDPSVGDILTSVGSGNIKLTMDKSKGFGISGEYTVHEGDYLFTLGGLWNKRFIIQDGGSIIWNGTPLDARLDLRAVYGVKSSLAELYMGLNDNMDAESSRKVPVECVLSLKDRLMNPVIELDVDFPTLDNQTTAYLKSTMSSQDELNKQVFSLLLMNKFMAPDYASNSNIGTQAGTAGVTTLTELVSSKLSQLLSSFSNAVDVGVSYRVGDELTSDELELALSTNLFNDRVTISANGNVDVGNNNGNASNSSVNNGIAGDFDMDLKLNKQGTLQLKAYSHTDEKILYNSTETIQGIGISYQEYFDTFGDLLRKYFSFFKKKEKDNSE